MACKKPLSLFSVALVAIGLFTSSCSSTKATRKHLAKEPSQLDYLLERPSVAKKSAKTVYLEFTSAPGAGRPGEVNTTRWHFIPLIFYYKFHSTQDLSFFEEGVKQRPEDFVRQGFQREFERHCHYQLTTDRQSADYTLLISLDSIFAHDIVRVDQHLVVVPVGPYVIHISISDGNVEGGLTYCSLSYQLYNEHEDLISSGKLEHEEKIPNIKEQPLQVPFYHMRNTAHTLLVEGLGTCFRENFTGIITAINSTVPVAEKPRKIPASQL